MKMSLSLPVPVQQDDIQQVNSCTFLHARSVSREEYPFLADHIMYGECLFPAVMMLELMAECGRAIVPDSGPIMIEDFRILRPLKMHEPRLVKLLAVKESGVIRMSLCADYVKNGQTVRKDIVYAQSVFKTDTFFPDIAPDIFLDRNARCFSLSAEDIYYNDILQSGPVFQGLDRELCFGEKHYKGRICTAKRRDSALLTEPFLIDNGFQLADLSTKIFQGYGVLPVGMDRLCVFGKLSTPDAYCYGMVTGFEDRVSLQNFILCDESDKVILMASGVRMHYKEKYDFDVMEHFQRAHERTIHRSAE